MVLVFFRAVGKCRHTNESEGPSAALGSAEQAAATGDTQPHSSEMNDDELLAVVTALEGTQGTAANEC
jgi:hypothetical protein